MIPKHTPSNQAKKIYADLLATSWKSVQGYITDEEATVFIDLILSAPDLAIVEIGSWKGKSTTLISYVMKLAGNTHTIYAIDPHEGKLTVDKPGTPHKSTLDTMKNNLDKTNSDNVTIVVAESQTPQAVSAVNEPIGLLWIDGLHTYEAAKRDILTYWNKLVIGGYIVFHDMNRQKWYPGLYQLQTELVTHAASLSHWSINQKLLKATKNSEELPL